MSEPISALSLIQAGFVWAATLAWSDAIRGGVDYFYPHDDKKKFEAALFYALLITVLVVIIFWAIANGRKFTNRK